MNCGNCGSNVNPGDMFCQNCGAGINNSSSNQNPVISDEVLVDAYIGKNIEEIRKGNFSWCTFFFDVFYAFYRKMWLFGILYLLSYLVVFALLIVLIVILVKQTNEITFIQNYVKYYSIIYGGITLTSLALRLIFSFKFKKAYLKHATKKVEQIKVRNMGKTNEEIKKECSKKGGTSIFGIFLAILLPIILYLLLAIPYAIQNKNTLDKVQNSVAKDSAHVIIEEVEMAYFSASIDKELITLEDVRNEYEGKFSTWEGNVIKSTHYDFTCGVTVNNDNKMLVSCDVFGEKIESELLDLNIGSKENNQANNTEEKVEENNNDSNISDNVQIYKELYAFKMTDDSIYALLNNANEKLIINLKKEICGNDHCGQFRYEYIDNILYIYHIGVEDATYNVNKNKYISVYSIDLTKNEAVLKKEYDIDKQDGYVESVAQTKDAVYYLSYKFDSDLYCYVSKIFKFDRTSKKIQEIYDFKGFATIGAYDVFAINNKNLYVITNVSYGTGSSENNKQFISIDLTNNKSKVIRDDWSISYYDNVGKNIFATITGNNKKTITRFNLNDLSSQDITLKISSNRFYGIGDIFVGYDDENHIVEIVGKNRYSIDLTKYVSGTIKPNYTYLELSDDYSVIALVYLEGNAQPEKYKINCKTGKVTKIEIDNNDVLNNNYLYVK